MNELSLPEELAKEIVSLEELTKNVIVRTPDERALVFQTIQTCKVKKKSIVEFFADMKDKAFKAHRAISLAEKTETDRLDAFEKAGKQAILVYDQAEEAKRQAERRQLQAIADEKARREREKAEAEARRQREIEEEARRKAEEARRAAEQANAAERAKLLKEAEAADRKAAAASAKAEVHTDNAAAVIAPVVQIAPAIQKQEGESKRQIWRARVIDVNQVSREYMIVNEKALDGIAKATKGAIKIPGVEMYAETTMAIR